MLFASIRHYFKVKRLQKQFDAQVEEVQRLMDCGDIKASGHALLEAERLRKEIETLDAQEANQASNQNTNHTDR